MSFEKPVIQVHNISKCFKIYQRPQDLLKQLILPTFQKLLGVQETQQYHEYWALQHI
jgi:lipopolysaccharide transport system ATP-binding protein